MRALTCLAAVAASAPLAAAFDASIRMAANGAPRITVAPGEVFRVEALITYPSWASGTPWVQFAGVQGSMLVRLDAGSPSNFSAFYPPGALVNLGQYRGGSRVGIDIAITPAFFTGGFMIPQIPAEDGLVGGYDLAIDEPGTYTIRWMPTDLAPSIRLYPSVASPAFVDANSTYTPATILVTDCRPDLTTASTPGSPGYGVPNGQLNNDDFFYFLAQYAAGNLLVADMTAAAQPGSPGYGIPNGVLNNDDFFFYLGLFAAGC